MSHQMGLVVIGDDAANIAAAVDEQVGPFDEAGDWFADGTRWDYWLVGGRYPGRLLGRDVQPARAMTEKAHAAWWLGKTEQWHSELLRDMRECPENSRRAVLGYEFPPDLETYRRDLCAMNRHLLSAPVFVRGRCWNERHRQGWFNTDLPLEGHDSGSGAPVVASATKGEIEATIITWREDEPTWRAAFRERFLAGLSPDDQLVAVDFHV